MTTDTISGECRPWPLADPGAILSEPAAEGSRSAEGHESQVALNVTGESGQTRGPQDLNLGFYQQGHLILTSSSGILSTE